MYGTDEEDAIRKQIAKEEQLRSGRLDANITVRRWAEVWMETYINQRDIIEASRKMYERKLQNIILPAIGSMKLGPVTAPAAS